jgi:hypothetical protein
MDFDLGIEPEFDPELYGEERKPEPERKGLNQNVNFVYVLLAITVAALLCFQLLPHFMGL